MLKLPFKKSSNSKKTTPTTSSASSISSASAEPRLARRSLNRHASLRSGRVIGERREKLETASERANSHKRMRREQTMRLVRTIFIFVFIGVVIILACRFLFAEREERPRGAVSVVVPYAPTIEVIDEDAGLGGRISSRTKEYIGQAEADFRDLGYIPVKAIIPSGAVREVDFYLDGYTGFIKLITDRPTAVSVEDADRMIRYLDTEKNVKDFAYIDVRISGKAYWKSL